VILHQHGADADEDGSENERPQNAVEENAVLVFRRDREITEDDDEDENIIYRKRFLDDVTGQKLQADLLRRRPRIKSGNRKQPRVLRKFP
jgi:hypothetical protein